ncbi:hypothetical protein, partial [Janthinobacterium sp. HH107]|uniref:hypothetical protein n=1 Tax=Janthinobacterium sp. HH107 TaxID=1537279 RepID=UPI001C401C97
AIDKALCLSAAKKEEYEAICYVRQLLLFSRFTLHLHASFSEGADYSPALRAPQGLFSRAVKRPWHRTCLYSPMHCPLMRATLGLAATLGTARLALLCSHL